MTQREASTIDFEVIIVGFGPVGATLAALLGECGVSTLVLDREAEAYHLPRAVHFDDEVMRVFQTIGVADAVAKTTLTNLGMRFVDAAGKLLLDWPRPQVIGPQGWHASYRFHQPDLERILRSNLERYPTVAVRTRCDAFLADDRNDHAEVRYEDLSNGQICTVTAKNVVGCDGARSLVRRFIGSTMEDHGFHERWLVVDVLLKAPKPELGDHTIQHCNPARPATYARGPGNRRRWEITVLDHEESHAISAPSAVWELLKPWITRNEAELERAAVYTFHSVVAKRWRKGRLLLAGDAAHQTPPFMGQGMCAGLRDAANLAWKLALCVQDKAGDSLLDSYQAERHPHAREYIQTAIRLGGLINTSGTEEALGAAFRQPDGSAQMESIAPRLGRGLAAGSAVHAGRLFPQPRLGDASLMDDNIGYAPVLVAEAAFWTDSGLSADALERSGIHLLTTREAPGAAEHLLGLGTRAVMVRPDRYVLGSANDKAALGALIADTLPSPKQRRNGRVARPT